MKGYENMIIDSETNNLIAETLAGHFECVYLIDILTTRGFVLSDKEGNPDYFGGIIIKK